MHYNGQHFLLRLYDGYQVIDFEITRNRPNTTGMMNSGIMPMNIKMLPSSFLTLKCEWFHSSDTGKIHLFKFNVTRCEIYFCISQSLMSPNLPHADQPLIDCSTCYIP